MSAALSWTSQNRSRRAIVLAGGYGVRLRPVVRDLPKPMAPVRGRPFLSYVLDELEENGFTAIVLAVSWRREAIIDAFGCRYRAMELRYSIEREPLGTGGAIRQAFTQLDDEMAFVLNGDTFQRLPYDAMQSLATSEDSDAVVAVRRIADASRYGAVELDGNRICKFTSAGAEGEGLINAGAYLLRRGLVEDTRLAKTFSFERELLTASVGAKVLTACPVDGDFIDIGIPEDYARAQIEATKWREQARQ
ncbi:D-glycero-alpha-D-manno-heptose+1-phosphate+guanylyltransferase [Methylocapsa aurea]|uniref:nucleotidyltransferase family protein n=1 Tax=Methylocapsa aurea TaxID=663610 RepID=UPI003D18AD45